MSSQKKDVYCLALDGGGIRGILELVYLSELEKRTNKKVHELFHTVAGTSTGGLISLLLTVPRKDGKIASASQVLEIYKTLSKQIFTPYRRFSLTVVIVYFLLSLILSIGLPFFVNKEQIPYASVLYGVLIATCFADFCLMCHYFSKPTYSPKGLEDFVEGQFGKTRTLKDAKTNVGVVAVDIEKERSFMFNSMRAKIDPECSLHCAALVDVVRATTSAPSFFPPMIFDIKDNKERISLADDFMTPWWDPRHTKSQYDREVIIFEDGGTKANNPSVLCLELSKWKLTSEGLNPDDFNFRLLSLGTGELNKALKVSKKPKYDSWYTPSLPDGGLDHVLYRLLGEDVFNVTINSQNVHVDVSLQYKLAKREHDYQRVQFEVTEHHLDCMDDASDENIKSLVDAGKKAVELYFDQTEKFFKEYIKSDSSRKEAKIEESQPKQNDEESDESKKNSKKKGKKDKKNN